MLLILGTGSWIDRFPLGVAVVVEVGVALVELGVGSSLVAAGVGDDVVGRCGFFLGGEGVDGGGGF